MTTRRTSTPALGTCLLALLLGLGACGGGGSDDKFENNLDRGLDYLGKNGAVAEAFASPLRRAEPDGTSARIFLRIESPSATVLVEYEAGRTPAELDLILDLGPELAVALASVEAEDSGCPEPDVTMDLRGNELRVRIAHPAGPVMRAETATQEIRLAFEGTAPAADAITILHATAQDEEDRPVHFTLVSADD